jgi:regulatory protein
MEAAYATAVSLLARRPHTRKELEQKLLQRGYADKIRSDVIRRLNEHAFIDDETTCENYCLELIRKGFGPRAIRQRLAGRGIDNGLIRKALTAHYPLEAVRESARRAAVRKLKQLESRYAEKSKLRPRLARFLAQRGFPADIVHEVMDDVIDD